MKKFIILILYIYQLCGASPTDYFDEETDSYRENDENEAAMRRLERRVDLIIETIFYNNSSKSSGHPVNCNGLATGVQTIFVPVVGHAPFSVLCDAIYGGNWTIIQRRINDNMNFYRPWSDYKKGFGSFNGSFFIGLDHIHAMTAHEPYELLILLEDFDRVKKYARYDSFLIGDESEGYALKDLGRFSGNAGDNLSDLISQKFSTYDKDNTMNKRKCAERKGGAWWYTGSNKRCYANCSLSNLNGLYLSGYNSEERDGQGIEWHHFRGRNYSLKFVAMLIRPKTKLEV